MACAPDSTASIAVVGGGVIGLSLGFELAGSGMAPVVLDGDLRDGLATEAAGGMLAPVSEADVEQPELLELGLESLARYPAFVADIEAAAGRSCGLLSDGTLWVAADRDQRADLEHLEDNLRDKGLAVESWTAERVAGAEPFLSHRVCAGLYVPGDHQVDPRALKSALGVAVTARGGRIERGFRVERIERGPEGFILRGRNPSGPFALNSERVVVAAGAWSAHQLHPELDRFPLRPVRGQLVRLRGERCLTRVVRSPDVYLIPRADGELLLGATTEEMGFETRATGGATRELLRDAWELLPIVDELTFVEISVGLRSAVTDHLPVIGETTEPGLFVATGHYRNGILLAPATARHLADWIRSGRPPQALAPFRPQRFPHASSRRPKAGARRPLSPDAPGGAVPAAPRRRSTS